MICEVVPLSRPLASCGVFECPVLLINRLIWRCAVIAADLENIEAEEEEMDKMVFQRRRDAYKEAWRRSASQDTASLDGPARASAVVSCALAGPPPLPMPPAAAALRPALPRIDSTDFANEELMRRNEIFCGRL